MAQYLWLPSAPTPERIARSYIEYSYTEYLYNVQRYSSANIQVPTQPPVDAFSDATHEAFHEYLRSKPNRFRFTDEKYNLFRCFLAQEG